MSQDTGAGQNGGQEINIDELEVEILIVAKNPNQMKQTCGFLSRRGWPTVALGNISKAIEEIADKKPDIVMISLNHPSPAIMKLPDLIAQSFNLICVGFVETNDASSASKLQAMKLRYKISGSPSGPNFHRGIRKILAEKFNIKIDEKPEQREREAKEGPNVTVRGAGDKENDRTVIGGEKKARGPVVISGNKNEGPNAGAGGKRSGAAYMPDHSNQAGESGDGQDGDINVVQEGMDSESHSAQTGSLSGRKRNGLFGAGSGAGSSSGAGDANDGADQDSDAQIFAKSGVMGEAGGSGSGADADAAAAGAVESDESDGDIGSVITMGRDFKKTGDKAMGTGSRKKLKALTATDTHEASGHLLAGQDVEPKSETKADIKTEAGKGPGTNVDLVGMIKQSLFEGGAGESTPAGIMEKAVEKVLSDILGPVAGGAAPLTNVRRIGVFPVDSATIPGYLVLAMDGGTSEEQKRFLQTCESGLRSNLIALGVSGNLEAGFWLDVPEVSFSQWTENAAAFHFRLTHQGREVGVSFFQTEKPIAKAQASEHKEMMTITLADISSEEPVTFNAYLHLKENNRFYLYLRGGRMLPQERKQRLEAGGLATVFMKVEDVDNFRMFLAAAYLKETIRASSSEEAA